MNDKKKIIYLFVAIIVLVTGAFITIMLVQHHKSEKALQEYEALAVYEKEQLEEEYTDLADELEGFHVTIDNDSLVAELDREQARVQNLLSELKQVKSSDARRITELKKELASVRKVLVYYVRQVDSLNTVNTQLAKENLTVKTNYRKASSKVSELEDVKAGLEEKVKIASQLEASQISVLQMNKRGHKTSSLRRTTKIQISFDILKNISATVGTKMVYVRLVTPDNQVLQKDLNSTFTFEDTALTYSCKREFEYQGQTQHMELFWEVSETLLKGEYQIFIFVDGHLIGESTYSID